MAVRSYLDSLPLYSAVDFDGAWLLENSPWFTGAFITICQIQILIGDVYVRGGCLTVDGRDAYASVAYFLRGRPFILAGDHNCTPEELAASGVLDVLGARILASGVAIGVTREIDYWLISPQLVGRDS